MIYILTQLIKLNINLVEIVASSKVRIAQIFNEKLNWKL